ncbi:MAG: hypothetical protein JW785_12350 [Acidimicrobiia bacterium]|nr:hypothetical protein [Acidimicrobiia bacterium]
MHYSRSVTLAGVAVAGLALFLPQARFPIVGPVDGFDAAAWPVMLPLAPLALFALLGDRPEGYRAPLALVAVLLSCAAVVFSVAKVIDAATAVGAVEGGAVRAGPWVVLAGAALALLGSLLSFSRRIG